MLISDVSKQLWSSIEHQVSMLGFNFNKKYKEFIRSQSGSEEIFQLLFYEREGNIFVHPVVRLKIKTIENIYHKVSKKAPEFNHATSTLESNLGQIIKYYETGGEEVSEEMNMRYLIEDESDIKILQKAIPARFHEYVLPYFEQNNSIESGDLLLNTSPEQESIHLWLYPLRACIGLIAAKLNSNPRYSEIEKIYESELEEANPVYKMEFLELKQLLTNL